MTTITGMTKMNVRKALVRRSIVDLLDIRLFPEKALRQKCAQVKEVTPLESELLSQMHWTMKQAKGIGLAAPQVGILKRLFVADIGSGNVVKMVNPIIVKTAGLDRLVEGCLSIPGAQVEVERAYEVVVSGLDERGQQREWKAKKLLARVILHEMDHLDGKLIIDYLDLYSRIKFQLLYKTGKKNADTSSF
jgi:peptide deformylase